MTIQEKKQRNKEIEMLRNKGTFLANSKVLSANTGTLFVQRRSLKHHCAFDYLPCTNCYAYFIVGELWRHNLQCTGEKESPNRGRREHIGIRVSPDVVYRTNSNNTVSEWSSMGRTWKGRLLPCKVKMMELNSFDPIHPLLFLWKKSSSQDLSSQDYPTQTIPCSGNRHVICNACYLDNDFTSEKFMCDACNDTYHDSCLNFDSTTLDSIMSQYGRICSDCHFLAKSANGSKFKGKGKKIQAQCAVMRR